MRLALGVVFLWLGAALLWVASHGTEASSPWQVYQQITGAMRDGD